MSTTITRVCDHCGKQQGEGNHWFAVDAVGPDVFISTSRLTDSLGPLDACGEECALRLASRLLQKEGRE